MQRLTSQSKVFKRLMRVQSPLLLRWLEGRRAGDVGPSQASAPSGAGGSGEVWHEVSVMRSRDPLSLQTMYVVSEVDVTAVMAAAQQRLQQSPGEVQPVAQR